MSKSYGQYCGLARALDVVGARWSLLIVRELLAGPARYNELHNNLPGIATNLLATRLRDLEEAGVLERVLDTERNGVAYKLTTWGEGLRPAIAELVNWSTPLMVSGPQGDAFRSNWLAVALDSLLQGRTSDQPVRIGLAVDESVISVRIDGSGSYVEPAGDDVPNTVLTGEPAIVLGLASGVLTVAQAVAAADVHGNEEDLVMAFESRSTTMDTAHPAAAN